MARILVLTDRPQTDHQIFTRAVELAYQLDSRDVSAVVTCSESASLVAGCSFGNPDSGGISPDISSVWSLSLGHSDDSADRRFRARCREDAAFYGLKCETAHSVTSLKRTAAVLANVAGLMVVNRDTLLSNDSRHGSLKSLWSEVKCPWLIVPTNAEMWKRIVVATGNNAQQDELSAWGRHWSERFDIPLTLIELGSPPSPSVWSAITRWMPWSSPRLHREAVRDGLLAYGLGPGDLLLVNRERAAWPVQTGSCEVSLDDLVAVAPCSVGVAPTIASAATCELLFPHGLAHVDEPLLDFVST